jgi:peroxiredoxin
LGISSNAQDTPAMEDVIGLDVGNEISNFLALDQAGKTFNNYNELKYGPIVLVFYRGQGCKYCNKHMSNLQDSLELITQKGAQVIRVSPEKPKVSERFATKLDVKCKLLFDKDYQITNQFNVLFEPSKAIKFKYNSIGADLKNAHENEKQLLPIPATYVISQEGVIICRHFAPDYSNRSSVSDILKNL